MPATEHAAPPATEINIKRRHLLSWLWQLPLAAVALQALGMLVSFALPRKIAGSFGTVIDIGPLAEMPASGSPPLHNSQGRFWLVHGQDGAVALSHTCSHLDCLFTWDQEYDRFVCPCHGSQFDRQGQVLTGPATSPLDRYPLLILSPEGQVLNRSDDQGTPLPMTTPAPADAVRNENAGEAATPTPQPRLAVDTGRRISTEKSLL